MNHEWQSGAEVLIKQLPESWHLEKHRVWHPLALEPPEALGSVLKDSVKPAK